MATVGVKGLNAGQSFSLCKLLAYRSAIRHIAYDTMSRPRETVEAYA